MSSEAITKNDLAAILNQVSVAPAGNYIAENVNGDVSITRNVTAGGVIEAENLPGIIKMFAGTFAPTGWLLCNGDEVAISDYPFLYDVIGDTYGTPSDTDHFVLPDFRGRIPVGSGLGTASDSTTHSLGQKAGTEDAIIPYHNHSVNAVSITSSGGHKHNIATKWDNLKTNQTSGTTFSSIRSAGANSTDNSGGITIASNTGAHTHSVPQHNTNYAGSSGNVTGANMQPYTVVNYIISTGGISRWADSAGLPIVRDVTVNGQSIVQNEIANINKAYGFAYGMAADITLANSSSKLTLTNFSGSGCSLSSGGIKVNETGVYLASCTAYLGTGFTVNDVCHVQIYHNSTVVGWFGKRMYSTNPYENISVSPCIINMSANDVVYMHAYNQAAARGSVSMSNVRTYLTLNRIA